MREPRRGIRFDRRAVRAVAQPFALLDALGFSQVIEASSLQEVYERYVGLLAMTLASGPLVSSSSPQVVVVSDSVFVLPPVPDGEKGTALSRLVEYLCVLIGNSIIRNLIRKFLRRRRSSNLPHPVPDKRLPDLWRLRVCGAGRK